MHATNNCALNPTGVANNYYGGDNLNWEVKISIILNKPGQTKDALSHCGLSGSYIAIGSVYKRKFGTLEIAKHLAFFQKA